MCTALLLWVSVLGAASPARAATSTDPAKAQHWWSWAATAAKDLLAVLGFGLLALACAIGVIWLLLMIFSWGRHWAKKGFAQLPPPSRRLRDSRGYRSASWIPRRLRWIQTIFGLMTKRLLGPTLTISALDGSGLDPDVGKAIAALIRGRFDPGATRSFRVVTGHAAIHESLKSLGEISDEAKAAMGLISFFGACLPTQNYEAGGALQPAGTMGQGISLELSKDGSGFETATVWAKHYAPPAGEEQVESDGSDDTGDDVRAFQYLAFPAAAWVEHRVAASIRDTGNLPRDPTVWMLFNAGLAWQQADELDKAKAFYEEALDRDPDDSWSMSNLGLIEHKNGNNPKAERLLTRSLEELDKKGIANRDNPDWYRTKYNLSALHVERWMLMKVAALTEPEREAARYHRDLARDLSGAVAIAALEQLTRRWRRPSSSLRELLRRWMVPAALSVYGGSERARRVDPASVGYEWSPGGTEEDQRMLLHFLRGGLDREAALRYVGTHAPRDPRILYNLACGWAERPDFAREQEPLDKAIRYLQEALACASVTERKGLARGARDDPSFGGLCASAARKREFDRILAGSA
jgi:tetratricopeptide (TPR) repeat protein